MGLIGFATVIGQADIRDFVTETLLVVAPGAVGEGLTTAIRQGSSRGSDAFLSAIALFLGVAFAAQLEAVRAGVPEPRRPVDTP